jgi:hypothetical protein
MDKKRFVKNMEPEDIKGFEEFIEGQQAETSFLPRGVGGGSKKNETGFEHFTFLSNDSDRLMKLRNLLNEKLPFSAKYDQSVKLVREQKEEIELYKKKLFEVGEQPDSPYKKSLGEIFNSFFEPPKT